MTHKKNTAGTVLYYAVAVTLALIICIPFFWMVSTSLKSRGAIMSVPVEWIPKQPSLEAYIKLFTIPGFGESIANSFYLAITCTAVRLLFCAMAAYALSKIRFRGQKVIFALYITALMIPVQITFIPVFIIMTRLGLANSLEAFMLPQMFNAFAIFMLRQRMMAIHDAFIEAAVIDGAGLWRIFQRIVLPLCGGTLATLSILSFMELWNDYLLPLVLLSDRSKATLTILLSTLSGQYKNQYNLMMAGALVSIIPILIVYISAQKYFKKGLTIGGVKG